MKGMMAHLHVHISNFDFCKHDFLLVPTLLSIGTMKLGTRYVTSLGTRINFRFPNQNSPEAHSTNIILYSACSEQSKETSQSLIPAAGALGTST
jgi:hypothetical protein